MGLFRPYQQAEPNKKAQPAQVAVGAPIRDDSGRKVGPTPSRKQSQEARMQALHPKLTKKEAKQHERDADARRRTRSLAEFEDLPERVLLRNYIDSRWSFTEFMWPILLVLLAFSFLGMRYAFLVVPTTVLLWIVMAIGGVNIFISWTGFKQELRYRFPRTRTQGLMMMLIGRMITMRRVRNPGTAVSRGGKY